MNSFILNLTCTKHEFFDSNDAVWLDLSYLLIEDLNKICIENALFNQMIHLKTALKTNSINLIRRHSLDYSSSNFGSNFAIKYDVKIRTPDPQYSLYTPTQQIRHYAYKIYTDLPIEKVSSIIKSTIISISQTITINGIDQGASQYLSTIPIHLEFNLNIEN